MDTHSDVCRLARRILLRWGLLVVIGLIGRASALEPQLDGSVFAEVTEAIFEPGSPIAVDGAELWAARRKPKDASRVAEDYGNALESCAELAARLVKDPGLDLPESPQRLVDLMNQDHALETANVALMEHFTAIRESCVAKGLPNEILARHDAAVKDHSASHEIVMALLGRLRETSGEYTEREIALGMLATYFEAHPVTPNPKLSLDPVSDPSEARLPQSVVVDRAELGLSSDGFVLAKQEIPPLALQPPPVPDDLAQTLDITFTPEIVALAAELDGSPLKIFNWVRGNIRFDPYVGSRRGAAETLRLKAGNDTDQASLLMALLRTSGVYCRYSTGTVEMTAADAANWLGVSDPHAAGSILATAGMEGVTIINGSEGDAIRCRRVWVDANVPYSNYRGAGPADGETLWVRLDPAFKHYENHMGRNIIAESGFNADAFLSSYFATPDPNSVLTKFEQTIANSLSALDPPVAFNDNLLRHEIAVPEMPWLPASLPNKLLSIDNSWSTLPTDHRYRLRFLVSGEGAGLDFSITLPEIAGKQVTLSFIGATPADQSLIDSSGGVFGVVNPSLVKMKPQLRVDGCVVATGTGAVTLGKRQTSQIFFTDALPGGTTDSISNVLIAGNYEAHAIDTGRVQVDTENRELTCPEDFTGGFLHRLGMLYLEMNDQADRRTAEVANARLWKGVSNAILSQQIKVLYSGSTPITFDYVGLFVDADRAGATPFAADGSNIIYAFSRIRGAQSSQNENLVFETNLGRESVSTIKILSLASLLNIPLFEITPANASSLIPQLNQSVSTKNDVITQLNAGKRVTIPRDAFTYFDWSGTGYIQLDPATGTGGYIIDGGISGGSTAEEDGKKPGCEKVTNVTITPPGGVYTQCQKEPVEIAVTLTGYDEECEIAGTRIVRKTIIPADLPPKLYKFPFGSAGDCGCAVTEVSIRIKPSQTVFADSNGRASRNEILEIANQGSEVVNATSHGNPLTQWQGSNGASPSTQTGEIVPFTVALPPAPGGGALPSLAQMLFPPTPALIEATNLSDSCGTSVSVYPFTKDSFNFTFNPGAGLDPTKRQNLGELRDIITYLDNIQDVMKGLKEFAEVLHSPVVPPTPSFGGSIQIGDSIEENLGNNRIQYKLEAKVAVEAGVTGEFSIGTGLVGIPPPLAEAAVFFTYNGTVGTSIGASVVFERPANFIKATLQERQVYGFIKFDIGGRASIAAGVIELKMSASTELKLLGQLNIDAVGSHLIIAGNAKLLIGNVSITYTAAAFWGIFSGEKKWDAVPPYEFPTGGLGIEFANFDLGS